MALSPNEAIRTLTPELEESIRRNPLLNLDTFVIPSPFVGDTGVHKDYDHSYVWMDEGEMLGYILVYSNRDATSFLVYKLLTSPFVRGRGIGTALLDHLVDNIAPDALVYLYIWQRRTDTLEFFLHKGFSPGETIVYRNLVYAYISAPAGSIVETSLSDAGAMGTEELGKTRHDARKTMRLLSSMVDMLSLENCGRIIEDINRETTSLVNTLNSFRDAVSREHEINVTHLVLERIVPFVGAARYSCELRLKLSTPNVLVLGNHDNFSRAFINLVSNALDAIAETERQGVIEIKIAESDGEPYIRFRDNGIGFTPEQLRLGPDGVPLFVGKTTKRRSGEGLGTLQIYETFGPENIVVESVPGRGSSWRISLRRASSGADRWFLRLEARVQEETRMLADFPGPDADHAAIGTFVWQTRRLEIVVFEIVQHFSAYHNVRTIFRTVFSFLMDDIDEETLRDRVGDLRVDRPQIKEWLIECVRRVRSRWRHIDTLRNHVDMREALFRSYGQAVGTLIIFTINPATGECYATDRKLAEHLDFAPYLGGDREALLRGEMVGDVNDNSQPIFLGVWSIDSDTDLQRKLRLLRQGARALIDIGVHPEKKLGLYQTTHVRHARDIDSDAVSTFGEFAALDDPGLVRFTRDADTDVQEMMIIQD